MSKRSTVDPSAAASSEGGLAALPNPFRSNVVKDAWQALPADVETIHERAFRRCLDAVAAAERGEGYGVLLYGSPGAGKTHVLARLRGHLAKMASTSADRALRCIFVSVRLNTHASELWPHVRRVLVDDLLREVQGLSQLQRLVAHQIAAHREEKPTKWIMALRVLDEVGREAIEHHIDAVAERLHLDPSVSLVFRRLATRDRHRDAAAWLRGDALTPEAVTGLGLADIGDAHAEPRALVAQRVVTSLCRLAGENLPIVFCFDQIEALEPNDRASLSEFGKMASELCDADPNVALISSVQTSWLEPMRDGIRQAMQDRVFAVREVLGDLGRREIEQLVRAKLATVPEIAELAPAGVDPGLHPFRPAFLDELAALPDRVPRRILARASDVLDELRLGHAEAPRSDAERVDALLPVELERARARGARLGSARETLLHGMPILASLVGSEPERVASLPTRRPPPPAPTPADALVDTPTGPVAVFVSDDQDMRAAWRKLQRVLDLVESRAITPQRTLLVRPAALPIPRSAKKTRERLDAILEAGVRFAEPTASALAALEALRALVSATRSGDLGDRDGALPPATVVEWLQRNLDPELVDLATALGPAEGAPRVADGERSQLEHLREILGVRHVVEAAELVEELGLDVDAIVRLASAHPDHVGILGGPPAVLFGIVVGHAGGSEGSLS